ncbi:hypothetical protein ACH4UV_11610 [Streptomyces sp. NPDC020802]|uniref:hypothetical protein n=1 Tax=Streptomyces sp. NPDC020802 TaxID=3365094 RepID=UPI0037AB5498
MLVPVQMQVDRAPRAKGVGSMTEGLRKMRQTRIEKPRRSVRVRPYEDEELYGDGLLSGLDPRDPDIVRAKRLRSARHGGDPRP